jgi:nucleoside-diphosphate-sugar epimerase
VIHMAAVTHARDPRRYAEVNVGLTARLLEAAGRAGVERFVHVSTHVLDPGGGAYADSKRHAEELVRAAGVPFVIVRLPEVYGGDSREGLDRMIAAARAGHPIFVVGEGGDELRPLHVDDAVAALVGSLDAPRALEKTYTLAGQPLTMREAAEACRDAFASRSRVILVPELLVRVAARAARVLPLPLFPDQLDRLRAPRPPASPDVEQDLGIRPRPFLQG